MVTEGRPHCYGSGLVQTTDVMTEPLERDAVHLAGAVAFNFAHDTADAGENQSDTRYEIFHDGAVYKVRITRLGDFKQEADGFTSYADADAWVAQARRLGTVRAGQQEAILLPHLRVVEP